MNGPMHDWTLLSITVDWRERQVTLLVSWNGSASKIAVRDFSYLEVPRLDEWGRSVSINGVYGPTDMPDGRKSIKVEMQSGDVLSIVAQFFDFPAAP